MQGYIKKTMDFLNSYEDGELLKFIPKGLCPFLYYNLLPYIACITNDGRFGWVRYLSDSHYRKEICKSDFMKRNVNRIYPNEVLVQCPDGRARLVCGIGLFGLDEIKIRILDLSNNCPNNHLIQDEFLIERRDAMDKARGFNRIFPFILLNVSGYKGPSELLNNGSYKVKIDEVIAPCRYSRKGQWYTSPLLPQNFCIHLFQLIYPDILSMMYDANVPKDFEIKCHCQEELLKISIRKEKINKMFVLDKLFSFAERAFEMFFFPYDMVDYKINILVSGKVSNNCGLKNNYIYEVNIKDKNFMCPASFHVLYPYLVLANKGFQIDWDNSLSDFHIPCPDCRGTAYRIDRQSINQSQGG